MHRTVTRRIESTRGEVELFEQGKSLGRFDAVLNIDQEFSIVSGFGKPDEEIPGLQIIDARLLETNGLGAQMFSATPLLARFEDGREMECWLNGSNIVASGNLRDPGEK